MQRKGVTLVTLIISLLAIGLMVNVVSAGTATTVTGLDTRTQPGGGGISSSSFNLGSIVYVYWGSVYPDGSTVDVVVTKPDGTSVTLATNAPTGLSSGSLSFTVDQPGIYDIELNGVRFSVEKRIAGVSIFVLPESALGTLMAITAGVGAIGVFKIAKINRPKTIN